MIRLLSDLGWYYADLFGAVGRAAFGLRERSDPVAIRIACKTGLTHDEARAILGRCDGDEFAATAHAYAVVALGLPRP